MDLGLKGKVAVITGGTDGIGKAAALAFAREGAHVAICARREELLKSAAAEIEALGAKCIAMRADVTRPEDIGRFVEHVAGTFGRIDILVNNAGTSIRGAFETISDDVWMGDIELKVFGAIRMTRAALPHIRKAGGGRIINITTVNGKQPAANSMPTSVSRAAGIAITKALSKELAAENILVNTVCIGKIKAGQHERKAAARGIPIEQYYDEMKSDIPMKRVGEASEAANVIVFLASAAASYVTGTSVHLDGGASGVV